MAYWSWLLTAVGVFGLYLAGRQKSYGWAVGIGAQLLWIAYATATHQWGFYVSAVAYGWVYTKNFLAWRTAAQPAYPVEFSVSCTPGSARWNAVRDWLAEHGFDADEVAIDATVTIHDGRVMVSPIYSRSASGTILGTGTRMVPLVSEPTDMVLGRA